MINDAPIFVTEFDALFDIITADWSEIFFGMTRKLVCKVYLYLDDKTVLNSVIII